VSRIIAKIMGIESISKSYRAVVRAQIGSNRAEIGQKGAYNVKK